MEIKGSGNKYYEVNLEELTCSCKDWTCRRHNFSKGDNRRLCKHLVEAIEISSSISHFENLPRLPNNIEMDNKKILELNNILKNCDYILKYSVGGEVFRKSMTLTEYIPVVIELVNSEIPTLVIDSVLSEYRFLRKGRSSERYYIGDLPIVVIPANESDFLFQSVYYDLSRDEFIRLSSISIDKLKLMLTRYGFIDKNNKLIDMKIHTVEELCDLLKIDQLV